MLLLYVLLPPVIFFNLAAGEIDVDHGVGLVLGIVAVLARGAARLVGREPRRCSLPRPQVGAVVCAVLSVNTGYLGYPLTVALLGRDQLSDRGPLRRPRHRALPAARRLRGRRRLRHQGRRNAARAGAAPSSPATRRSTRRSPACSRPTRWRPTSSSTSPQVARSSRSCRSASSPSAPPWPRTPSTASCRCRRR